MAAIAPVLAPPFQKLRRSVSAPLETEVGAYSRTAIATMGICVSTQRPMAMDPDKTKLKASRSVSLAQDVEIKPLPTISSSKYDSSAISMTKPAPVMTEQDSAEAACAICYDAFPASTLVHKICTASCKEIATEKGINGICRECIQKSLTTQINDCFLGVLPQLVCVLCNRRAAFKFLRPFIPADAMRRWLSFCLTYTSIHCDGCECRVCLLPAHAALGALDAYLDSNGQCYTHGVPAPDKNRATFISQPSINEELSKIRMPAGNIHRVWRSFYRFSLCRISAGELLDELTACLEAKGISRLQSCCWHLLPLLKDDIAQQAALWHAFLMRYPEVDSPCCERNFCYRCKASDYHRGSTCEEYGASLDEEMAAEFGVEAEDLVCSCPGCGIQFIKGDGCTSVTCICGESIDYEALIRDAADRRYQQMIQAKIYGSTRVKTALQKWICRAKARRQARIALLRELMK